VLRQYPVYLAALYHDIPALLTNLILVESRCCSLRLPTRQLYK